MVMMRINKIVEDSFNEGKMITIALFVLFFGAILYMFQQFMTGGKLFYPQ